MGAGIALEAKKRYPQFPQWLGQRINQDGNHVFLFYTPEGHPIITFPTKRDWKQNSTLRIIGRSAKELVLLANDYPEWKKILLPPPGCGKGNLEWSEVKPTLDKILDERFIVVWKSSD